MTRQLVEFDKVTKNYQAGEVSVPALYDATLSIAAGDYVAIVGPSGSGKSTMLNILGLLDQPSEGRYLLDGIDTSTLSERQRAGLRSRRIGFVFQAFHLLAHRTVLDNVRLSTIYNGMPRGQRTAAAAEAIEQVGLSNRIDFQPSRLSGGERQRVAIARALVIRPALLLADEPTGNLDRATGESILVLFDQLREKGLTIVVVTHDQHVAQRSDRAIRLTDGRALMQ